MTGKIVMVTGAASGIGRACAQRFAQAGATVAVTDVVDDAGAAVAESIGGDYHHLDVADPAAWDRFASTLLHRHGHIDLAVLNAGIRLGAGDIGATPVDDYLRLIGINQHGVFFGLRAMVPLLEAAGGGAVVVTASRAAVTPLPNDLPYAMSKHAVAALVRSSAGDLQRRGISINAICPGTVDTGFLAEVGRERLEAAGIAVMDPETVAEGMLAVLTSGATGECFVHAPGGEPTPFPFATVDTTITNPTIAPEGNHSP